MKQYLILLFFFISTFVTGQESLEPLGINPKLARENQRINRSIDMTYIYAIDTIKIPFKDDFSKDRFKKFNATPTDANVSDTMFHVILNAGIPDVDTAAYMFDTTFNFQYTPTAVPDSFQIDTIPLASLGFRTICDLNAYPVTCITKEVWPPYNTIDTIGTTPSPDGIYIITPADISQDSALVYFVKATDTLSLWQDVFAYRNDDYAIKPITIGVTTMDGLNENGYPYDFSTAFTHGKADYLTSKPIRLDLNSAGTPSAVVDSFYFSFYYQAQGLGNEPEPEDSLVVEFWSPNDNAWNRVWGTPGEPLDSNFKQAMIKINDSKYLNAGFKFRFLNYSSLSGSFDHWNIDYVFLNSFRTHDDTIRHDVGFTTPLNTLIKNYTSMPWKHFKWDPVNSMIDTAITFQRNNSSVGRLVGNNDIEIRYKGTLQQTISQPNTPSINGFTNFTTEFFLPLSYFYDTLVNDTNATFNVLARHSTTPDFCRDNDTIFFNQEFSDYYSYDDGTAEAAYGVQGLGTISPKIASKFFLLREDTMKSVFIHFTPSAYNMSSTNFFITIWNDQGGQPGSIIMQNTTLDVPRYNLGVNGFYEYPLDMKQSVGPGIYYVGIIQTTPDRINIGFDKNIDNTLNTFYNSNGTWQNTGFEGTLMIRPSFVYQRDYSVGVPEINSESLSVYPNPTNSILNLDPSLNYSDFETTIYDISGKEIYHKPTTKSINVSHFQEGVYILKMTNKNTSKVKIAKFVKSNS